MILKSRINKLENILSTSNQSIGVWVCPTEPPPPFEEYKPLLVVVLPDESLTQEQIDLKKDYLDQYERSKL